MKKDFKKELKDLQSKMLVPSWLSEEGFIILSKGYLLPNETPKAMYHRVAKAAAKAINEPKLEKKFFEYMWNGWLCPATPVLTNLGTERGLPISCFTIDIGDSVKEITEGLGELAALTKSGGGVGVVMDRIRSRGSPIKEGLNGESSGVIPFIKMYDSTILGIAQGSARRGAASVNLNIEHGDWQEFIRIRRPEGDINRQCHNIHQCTIINDSFMDKLKNKDKEARIRWTELMRARMETGESYIFWKDKANKANPVGYKKHKLEVNGTNICSEIMLHTDSDHSFICCLSSLNLAKWEEWKNTDLPQVATYFLNGVLNEFIDKSENMWGLEKARRSALKGRAIGIGVLGWHTFLQSNMIPFESFAAMSLNNEIFRTIKEGAVFASKELASKYGEPEWCEGSGQYNSHLLAIAPTRSNSIISGDVSFGIEPIVANAYLDKTHKGKFSRKNKELKKLLESKGKDTDKVWNSIQEAKGSVQHLDFLNDLEKSVFKTAYEINQKTLVQQASQRGAYVCQAQSLNLFFSHDVNHKYFNDVHLLAYELPHVKTLYYCRSTSGLKVAVKDENGECLACES